MPLQKLKSKLFPHTSSTTTSTVHGIPQLIASPEDNSSPSNTLSSPPPYTEKKKWVPWMPKEPFADPPPITAPKETDRMPALSDEDREMMEEKEARAEERRKAVRAYLRDGRDKSRYGMMAGY